MQAVEAESAGAEERSTILQAFAELFQNRFAGGQTCKVLVISNVMKSRVDEHEARFDSFADVDDVLGAVVHSSKGDLGTDLS